MLAKRLLCQAVFVPPKMNSGTSIHVVQSDHVFDRQLKLVDVIPVDDQFPGAKRPLRIQR